VFGVPFEVFFDFFHHFRENPPVWNQLVSDGIKFLTLKKKKKTHLGVLSPQTSAGEKTLTALKKWSIESILGGRRGPILGFFDRNFETWVKNVEKNGIFFFHMSFF